MFFRYNVIPVTSDIIRQETNNTMLQLSNMLTYDYGFSQRTVNDFMWILDSRKHPEYNDHRNAFITVKEALFQMNANEPLNKVREMMQPAIDYFEKVNFPLANLEKPKDLNWRYRFFVKPEKLR